MISITHFDNNFDDWRGLNDLIHSAFSYMDGRIDPPSSLHSLNLDSLKEKALKSDLLLAWKDHALVGCVFAEDQNQTLYIGKLAISPDKQGKGIGKTLIGACKKLGIDKGKRDVELQTRIELVENHAFFSSLGFIKTGETAHAGYDRSTSITMQCPLTS